MENLLKVYEDVLRQLSESHEGWEAFPEGLREDIADRAIENRLLQEGFKFKSNVPSWISGNSDNFADIIRRVKVIYTRVRIANKNKPQVTE